MLLAMVRTRQAGRPMAMLAATAVLCSGCAHSGADSAPATHAGVRAVAPRAFPGLASRSRDRDDDLDHNSDDGGVLGFGHAADAADRRSVTRLVTRYFAAAANADGASGCRMLTPLVAETVAERDGGSPQLSGSTCAVVLSKLFARYHSALVEKQRTLMVTGVRVQGARALAILEFPTMPEKIRQIDGRRVRGSWKLFELLDSIIE
jgi:hypothetical protein